MGIMQCIIFDFNDSSACVCVMFVFYLISKLPVPVRIGVLCSCFI